ncbi:DUF222 domain-containing protein [Nocardioides sp. GXQ0305]|uniref:HNH endonuclease n=1 Tax=Nocardioides sp. GXQ0305 TaxID=3423912 RepID=UPI003D7E12D4
MFDRELDAALVGEWTHRLSTSGLDLDDADRIDLIRALEELKCAAEGAQARATAAFARSQRARAAERGVPEAQQGRGIAEQVALARRESPHRGRRHVGLAVVLETEMPHTAAALSRGAISEWRATLLARETAMLSRLDRGRVDAELASDPHRLAAMGDRQAGARAAQAAARLDPASVCARRRRAEADRTVTIRPAPDTMTWVTALLPVADGVALHATLRRAADSARAGGDPRSRGAVMADTLCARVVAGDGPAAGRPLPRVAVGLVMTDRAALLGADDTAHLEGFGPLPAELARELLRGALDADERVWLHRLYARPTTGELVATDSRQRLFRRSLRRLVVVRDQVCRTPWCDAPIREVDHVRDHQRSGPTSGTNGQGLCQACNHAKQARGWSARPRPGPAHEVETVTPTGHRYRSRAPALATPGAEEVRPGVWRLAG